MPEVTQTEVGRRLFLVHKQKGVEVAVKKIRRSLGNDWRVFTAADIETLKYILSEIWVHIDRSKWDQYPFSKLTAGDVRKIIDIGKEAEASRVIDMGLIEKIDSILTSLI